MRALEKITTGNRATGILVIDDEQMNLELIAEYLQIANYPCRCFDNAQQGLEELKANSTEYGCVLLDRMMPGMDGMSALKAIKAQVGCERIPVILQTAMVSAQDVTEGLQAGACYYLTKPYTSDLLLTIVKAALADYQDYRSLQQKLTETSDGIQCLRRGEFSFQTLEQAQNLAALLAISCANPDTVVMGLSELFVNAIEHGNLGIGYEEKTRLIESGGWAAEIASRLARSPYCDKKVTVQVFHDAETSRFVICDEGEGFDWEEYLHISPQRALSSHGRGIALAASLSFSELIYQGAGNEVHAIVRQ